MAHRFDRRRLAFESLESRGMLAALCGSLDVAVDGDAPSFDMEAPPATDAACEPKFTNAIETPDVFALPIDEPWFIDDAWFIDETWLLDETWLVDETWFGDEPAIDAREIDVLFEPLCMFGPAPEDTFANGTIEASADGNSEPLCFMASEADAERESELSKPGPDDVRQRAFATLPADLPAATARGASTAAIPYQMAAAFGFSFPAADGDAFRLGFGGGLAKRRSR